jgi:hypothetical protein
MACKWWPLLVPVAWLLVPVFFAGVWWMYLTRQSWSKE